METTCKPKHQTDQKDLVEKFAKALANYRVAEIKPLLVDGEYNYFNIDGEEVEDGNKDGFLDYLNRVCEPMRFTATEPATIEFDQCSFCKLGNPVVLLNGGKFPYNSEKFYEKQKWGLMLEFENELIIGVTFCATFIKTENPWNKGCIEEEDRPEGLFRIPEDMEEHEFFLRSSFDQPIDNDEDNKGTNE